MPQITAFGATFITLTCASCLAAAANPLSFTNDTGGSVKFYGQLSPTYLGFSDGGQDYGNLVDNTHSNSRVGFDLEQAFGNGQSLRFKFETGLGAPGSANFTQNEDDNPVWDWDKTDIRHVDLKWSGGFGAISVGQGSMASDGITSSDLSGTTMASTVTTADTAGGYFFRKSDGELSEVSIGKAYATFDGNRKGRIRYDTPEWNGLTFSASYGTDVLQDYGEKTYYDTALYYRRETDEIRVVAGLGYAWTEDDGETSESWAGSVSALHKPSGINGSFATGAAVGGGSYGYAKIGWIGEIWNAGQTAISTDYYRGQNFVTGGSESTQWGIQAAQSFDAQNLETYIGYAEYGFDDSSTSYKDARSLMAGLRWKF